MNSVGRIEVIRGNASALYGSASGGVIHLESRSWFAEPFVEIDNLGGSFGLLRNNINVGLTMGTSPEFPTGSSDFVPRLRDGRGLTTSGQAVCF